ncbi:unnamed protein product, partial [Mesorhabditis spiculigera]
MKATTRRASAQPYTGPSTTKVPVTWAPSCPGDNCPLTAGVYVNLGIFLIRVAFCIFVLLLGIKMPPDFMRTVTMAIYIPVGVGELFNLYEELVGFLVLFETSSDFSKKFINWNPSVQSAIFQYIHIDFLIMIIIGLHCCRICIRDDESIFVFPVKTISMVLQIVPLILCLLDLIPGQQDSNVVLVIIGVISQLTTLIGFVVITAQMIFSLYLVSQDLPYDHAASTDMQIRDARSRLVWFLIYLIIPYLTLIPFFLDAILWIITHINGEGAPTYEQQMDPNYQYSATQMWRAVMEGFKYLVSYYRPTWLVVLTCFCLPPYRRAVPLLCCCLPCCPRITVQPLPRKPKEMSSMYRDA